MRKKRFCQLMLVMLLLSLLAGPPFAPPETARALPRRDGWDDHNFETAFSPANRRGRHVPHSSPQVRQPGALHPRSIRCSWRTERCQYPALPEELGVGSGSFNLTVPVLRLPGRGLDLALDLHYNSRVWHRANKSMTFDIDRDWPTPGWSLGFGRLFLVGSGGHYMLVEPDGTRHQFTASVTTSGAYTFFTGRSTDGSLIDYVVVTYSPPDPRLAPYVTQAWATYPDGTQVEFGAERYDDHTLFPTRISDANGNFISIAYRNNVGPSIDTITDTVGRVVRFHYDTNNLLTAITAPNLGSGERTLIRLNYLPLLPKWNFPFDYDVRVRETVPYSTIGAIYFPATSTGYWFGDKDSYSDYGMLRKISEHHGMGLDAQGTITQGQVTIERVYKYPLSADPNNVFLDQPQYPYMTERWAGMDTEPVTTWFGATMTTSPRTIEVLHPDATRTIQLSYNTPGQFTDNLVYAVETRDANNQTARLTTYTWEQGADGAPRVKRTEIIDERNQRTAVEYRYGPSRNQVTDVVEYDYGGTLPLRTVHTEYETAIEYEQRHIYNLPKVVEVYQHYLPGLPRVESRTEYAYDGQTLANAPGVTQHKSDFNPYAPSYDPRTAYRGNVTQVTTYKDAVTPSGPIVETRRYDMTGNLIAVSGASCCEQTSYTYTAAAQYAYPETITRGSPNPASTARVSSSSAYDLNTGLLLSSTDTNGRRTEYQYNPTSLRLQTTVLSTGARANTVYDDATLTLEEWVTDAVGGIGGQATTSFNGLGQPRRHETLADSDLWDIVETRYDTMGRLWKQTRPYRSGQTPHWAEVSYDALGRVTWERAADGSEVRRYYNEAARPVGASTNPGQTVRAVDPWGRERWSFYDALGRLRQVAEPAPDGGGLVLSPGSLRTDYQYNASGKLIGAWQGPVGAQQARIFRYDSLGRLTRQHLPERDATLDDAGVYQGQGGAWSDVFTYDARSNLISHTDARGVKTIYDYANDPLDRLQSITYDTSGFGDTANPLLPASAENYIYAGSGDVTRVAQVTTAGVAVEDYGYDVEGRLSSKRLTLAGRSLHPLEIDFAYDSLHRLTALTYPAQYGVPGAPRSNVTPDYNSASQVVHLRRNADYYASWIAYNAAGQMVSLDVGPGGPWQIAERYDYDAASGLLNHQQVRRGATPLLDLGYGYTLPCPDDFVIGVCGSGRTGQVTRIVDNLSSTRSRSYTYDALGRLATIESDGTAILGRVSDWLQQYTYDAHGNRTAVRAYGAQPPFICEPPFCVPPPRPELNDMRDGHRDLSFDIFTNRITTPGFAYDAAGNQTHTLRADGLGQRFQYDAAGRLRVVTDDAGAVLETYQYGADRHRLISIVGDSASGKRRAHVWLGDQVLAEYRETPAAPSTLTWAKSSVYLGGRLLAQVTPQGADEVVHFHHPDRLGTRLVTTLMRCYDLNGDGQVNTADTQAIAQRWRSTASADLALYDLDSSGVIDTGDITLVSGRWGLTCANGMTSSTLEQATLPFGVALPVESSGETNPRFTSYDRSIATELDYAVNRFYDPQQGRFTQADPLGMDAADLANPQSLNMYGYVKNDPVNMVDPAGLKDSDNPTSGCWEGIGSDAMPVLCSEEIVVIGTPPEPEKPKSLTNGKGLLPGHAPTIGSSRSDGGTGSSARNIPAETQVCRGGIEYERLLLGQALPLGSLPTPGMVEAARVPGLWADNRSQAEVGRDRQRFQAYLRLRKQYPGITPESAGLLQGLNKTLLPFKWMNQFAGFIAKMNNSSSFYVQNSFNQPVQTRPPVLAPPVSGGTGGCK